MSQADAISALRAEIETLKKRITSVEQGPEFESRSSEVDSCLIRERDDLASPLAAKYAALESIVRAISSYSPAAAANIVAQLRSGTNLAVVAASAQALSPSLCTAHDPKISTKDPVFATSDCVIYPNRSLDPHVNRRQALQQHVDRVTELGLAEVSSRIASMSIPRSGHGWELFEGLFIDAFLSNCETELRWRSGERQECWFDELVRNLTSFPQSKSALRCVATKCLGMSNRDQRILSAAQSMYTDTLRSLRRSLTSQSPPTDTLCVILLLWKFEVVATVDCFLFSPFKQAGVLTRYSICS